MEIKYDFGPGVHHSELRTPTQPEPPMVLAYNKVRRIFQIKYSIDFENILQNTHTDLCSSCLAAWLPSSVIQVKNILFEKYFSFSELTIFLYWGFYWGKNGLLSEFYNFVFGLGGEFYHFVLRLTQILQVDSS